MNERELLQDCLRRLNGTGLDYMLTGSMASNFWGIPRTTHDLDFVLSFQAADIPSILNAFRPEFFIQEISVRSALRPPYQFNAIDTRSALKVDCWLLSPRPFDQQMFERRVSATLYDEPAWIATPEDTILHKLHWDHLTPSDRQRQDAAGVFSVQKQKLDLEYLDRVAEELSVGAIWRQIVEGGIKPKVG